MISYFHLHPNVRIKYLSLPTLLRGLLVFCFLSSQGAAFAISNIEMEFKVAEVCDSLKNCKTSLVADGVISPKSPAAFLKATEGSARQLTVFINGSGSDLTSGMALGKLIRAKGFDTQTGLLSMASEKNIVKTKYIQGEGGECISACLLAFLGGNARISQPNDVLGFYRLTAGNIANEKRIRAEALDYIALMGANLRTLDYLSSGNAEQIQRIPFAIAKKLNIENRDTASEAPWRIKTTVSGQTLAVVSEKDPSSQSSITLALTNPPQKNSFDNRNLRLIIFMKPLKSSASNGEILKLAYEPSTISLINNIAPIDATVQWERYQDGVQTYLILPTQNIEQLAEGRFFDLSIPSIASPKLNHTIRFSTEGLKSAILAIKK